MSERSPRILHVGKYLPPVPGGMETYLGDLLRVFRRHDWAVAAVVHSRSRAVGPSPANFHGVKLYIAPIIGELVFVPVALTFRQTLKKAIEDFKPDLLHIHMPNFSALWALTIPAARKLPWVLQWQADVGPDARSLFLRLTYPFYRPLERLLLNKSTQIIVSSAQYLQFSKALKPVFDRCVVIPLGLDTERLAGFRQQAAFLNHDLWAPSTKKILAVGRLTYYKGFDLLVKALRLARDCSLIIVGSGSGRQALDAVIEQEGVGGRVQVLSQVDDDDLTALYQCCDVLCLPSIDRSEAFGLVLLEAAFFGSTVIASDIPGSPTAEIAKSLGGAAFPAGDYRALAQELGRAPMRQRDFHTARELIEVDRDRIIAVYQRILRNS